MNQQNTARKTANRLERLDARGMLKEYGLRIVGTDLKDPTHRSKSGAVTVDDELALVWYVQDTKGYRECELLLLHRYADFKPLTKYAYRQFRDKRGRVQAEVKEGAFEPHRLETLKEAAQRHGQLQHFRRGKYSERRLITALHRRFIAALTVKIRKHPFKVPPRFVERNEAQEHWLSKQREIHGPKWQPMRAAP